MGYSIPVFRNRRAFLKSRKKRHLIVISLISFVVALWFASHEDSLGKKFFTFLWVYAVAWVFTWIVWNAVRGSEEGVEISLPERSEEIDFYYAPVPKKILTAQSGVASQEEAYQEVPSVKSGEIEGLLNLPIADRIREVIVGQDRALGIIERRIKLSLKEAFVLGDEKRKRILASFLFVGPTGVGKTETAKVLAEVLKDFGYEFLRIDMNQFSSPESVWSLIGSVKGYVGSDEPGILSGGLMKNPRRVILFDEVEKANPKIYDILLQFLDEGYVVERSTGERVYADASIVIFTSNYQESLVGEIAEKFVDDVALDIELRRIMETFFRKEFLGRMDEIVPFMNLTDKEVIELTVKKFEKYGLDKEKARELYERYKGLLTRYGIRYYLKKVKEEVLSNL